MCCIPLKSMFFLLYNATSFATIPRYSPSEVVGSGNVRNQRLKSQSTFEETPLFSQINTATMMIIKYHWGLFLKVQIWHINFLTHHLIKALISALELAFVTNKEALKNMLHNVIQYFSFPNNSRNIMRLKKNFLCWLYIIIINVQWICPDDFQTEYSSTNR